MPDSRSNKSPVFETRAQQCGHNGQAPDERPIGVLDSGFGGLSVLREIRALLPVEHLLYCADHAGWPYGEGSVDTIRQRVGQVAAALVAEGCKALVLACNTATAAAADDLRARLEIPVIGMEPAVKPALAATRSGVIGVLGTGGTLASTRFAGLLTRYAGDRHVVTQPAPELVRVVEQEGGVTASGRKQIATALRPLLDAGVDVVVLGCTHFPFLRDAIEAAAGANVHVIDTGPAVARQVRQRIKQTGIATPSAAPGTTRIRTTASVAHHHAALARLWGGNVQLEAVPLPLDATPASQ